MLLITLHPIFHTPMLKSTGQYLSIQNPSLSSSIVDDTIKDFHVLILFLLCPYSLVIIKRGQVVEADKNFSSQLRIMNFNDDSPYETLHSYISHGVAPYFKSFVRVTGKTDRFVSLCYQIYIRPFQLNIISRLLMKLADVQLLILVKEYL